MSDVLIVHSTAAIDGSQLEEAAARVSWLLSAHSEPTDDISAHLASLQMEVRETNEGDLFIMPHKITHDRAAAFFYTLDALAPFIKPLFDDAATLIIARERDTVCGYQFVDRMMIQRTVRLSIELPATRSDSTAHPRRP